MDFGVGTGCVDVGDDPLPEALMLDGHAYGDLVGGVGGKLAAWHRESGA